MRGKHDFNPALIGMIYPLLIIGLATHSKKPSQRSHWLVFIAIAAICIYTVFSCASSYPALDYFIGAITAASFFGSLDYILLRKYQRELQHLGQKPLSEVPFKDRLWWAITLSGNPRGIGWTHEPTLHLPPRPSSTPQKFILSQLMWVVFFTLQFDMANIFVRTNSCFATGGLSSTTFGWLRRSTAWLYVLLPYSILSIIYISSSIISVAIGMTEPRDWPHLFGSPLAGYTVRKLWGRVWHQILRKLLTGHADFITKQLRLPQSTFTTRLKLFIAFFVSGLIHHAAEYILYQNWGGRSMKFFLLQAVAITCEDIVIALATRLGFSQKPDCFFKFIGFIWVFAWFTYCLPLFEKMIHEVVVDGGLNYSLILGLWHDDWNPSRLFVLSMTAIQGCTVGNQS